MLSTWGNARSKEEEKKDGDKVKVTVDPKKSSNKGIRDDIDGEDDEESYYKWLEENPLAGRNPDADDDEQMEYDEDGNPIGVVSKKYIDPLPPINHNEIQYDAFEKNFYNEHPDIAR